MPVAHLKKKIIQNYMTLKKSVHTRLNCPHHLHLWVFLLFCSEYFKLALGVMDFILSSFYLCVIIFWSHTPLPTLPLPPNPLWLAFFFLPVNSISYTHICISHLPNLPEDLPPLSGSSLWFPHTPPPPVAPAAAPAAAFTDKRQWTVVCCFQSGLFHLT